MAAAVSVVILIVIIVVLTIYVIKTVKVKGHPQVGRELTSCTNRDADGRLGDQSRQRHQGKDIRCVIFMEENVSNTQVT